MQRRHHYDRAFEWYLRDRRVPYVAVDEARQALLPDRAKLALETDGDEGRGRRSLKSFDFVVYGGAGDGLWASTDAGRPNLLVDIKGRKVARRRPRSGGAAGVGEDAAGRLECWVTEEDVASLKLWSRLFGEGFAGAFVFVYWCDSQPPDGLFQEVFAFETRWYALRAILVDDYAVRMKLRSKRWRTVHLSTRDFRALSQPFAASSPAGG